MNPAGAEELYRFTVRASDINGVADLEDTAILINNVLSGAQGCQRRYNHPSGTLTLIGDDGKALAGSQFGRSFESMANSFCEFVAQTVEPTLRQRNMEMEFLLRMKGSMLRKRGVFVTSQDKSGLRQPWAFAAQLPTPQSRQ